MKTNGVNTALDADKRKMKKNGDKRRKNGVADDGGENLRTTRGDVTEDGGVLAARGVVAHSMKKSSKDRHRCCFRRPQGWF